MKRCSRTQNSQRKTVRQVGAVTGVHCHRKMMVKKGHVTLFGVIYNGERRQAPGPRRSSIIHQCLISFHISIHLIFAKSIKLDFFFVNSDAYLRKMTIQCICQGPLIEPFDLITGRAPAEWGGLARFHPHRCRGQARSCGDSLGNT